MPANPVLKLDKVDGSALDYGSSYTRKVRGGLVTGMSNGTPETGLEDCLGAANMPPLGSTIVVKGKALWLKNVQVRPVAASIARVTLVYDNDFGGTPTAVIIRTRSYLSPYETNRDPKTKKPIRVSWTDPNDANHKVPKDSIMFRFMRIMREIQVTGIKVGTMPDADAYEGKVHFCNDAAFRGLPRGHWVVSDGGTDVSKYAGTFQFHLAAIAKTDEDWSEFGTLRSKLTGRYVETADADLDDLIARDYDFGIIGQKNGVARVGPYPVTNFVGLFGFSSGPTFGLTGLGGA